MAQEYTQEELLQAGKNLVNLLLKYGEIKWAILHELKKIL
jgi:hypothetical protein